MPLDPKIAPELAGTGAAVQLGIYKTDAIIAGGSWFSVMKIEMRGQPTMLIDESGTARFIRKRKGQAYPYSKLVYAHKKVFKLLNGVSTTDEPIPPLQRPFGHIILFYEQCLREIDQKG